VTSALRALRPEDLLLSVSVLLGVPLAATEPGTIPGGQPGGALAVAAVVAAMVCLATRAPGQPKLRIGDEEAPLLAVLGPLAAGLALTASFGFEQIGAEDASWVIGPVFLVSIVVILLGDRLPVLDAVWRRVLVTPFIVVAALLFNGFASGILETVDPVAMVGSIGTPEAGLVGFIAIMLTGGLAAFYAMFVVAPRRIADPADRGFQWVLRFALFLLSSLAAIAIA